MSRGRVFILFLIFFLIMNIQAVKAKDKRIILIDMEEMQLYLLEDNVPIKKYKIAVGKFDTPSPIGSFKIKEKARWGGGFGSRWMGLNVPWGRYGIHGTNEPNSIGWASSHGCFRMRNKDVEELYSLVTVNTPVIIYGGPYGLLGNGKRTIRPGDRNSHVLAVQIRLKELGYYNGSLDGIFGLGMERSLLKFKKEHGLPLSNIVDNLTYKKLNLITFE